MGGAVTNTVAQAPPSTTPENVEALLEAARYGDMDDVVSLASSGVPLDSKDDQRRTGSKLLSPFNFRTRITESVYFEPNSAVTQAPQTSALKSFELPSFRVSPLIQCPMQSLEFFPVSTSSVILIFSFTHPSSGRKGSTLLSSLEINGDILLCLPICILFISVLGSTYVGLSPTHTALCYEVPLSYALHMAAANGHIDIVEYLINSQVDVNAPNEEKNTPLHWACLNGHVEVVKKLIMAGANVSALNSHERTPMDEAVSRGKLEVMDAINEAVALVELRRAMVST